MPRTRCTSASPSGRARSASTKRVAASNSSGARRRPSTSSLRISSSTGYGGRLSVSRWPGASSAEGSFSMITAGISSRPAASLTWRESAKTSVLYRSPISPRPPLVSP
jgi:hypothetical protein